MKGERPDRGRLRNWGELAAPHLPRVLAAMANAADERLIASGFQVLSRRHPPAETVRGYFTHPNRTVAVTALLLARDELPADELVRLLAPHTRPAERTSVQYAIEDALKRKPL